MTKPNTQLPTVARNPPPNNCWIACAVTRKPAKKPTSGSSTTKKRNPAKQRTSPTSSCSRDINTIWKTMQLISFHLPHTDHHARIALARGPKIVLRQIHSAVGELVDDGFHAIGGNGEADTIGGDTARRLNRAERWNADELPAQIDQRTTTIAWIDRCARLDETGDDDSLSVYNLVHLAIERADNPRGCGLDKTNRAAHCNGIFANLHLAGITNHYWLQI